MSMDGFMLRARLYGHAVGVIQDYLGTEVRERVMDRFSKLAGPLQMGGKLRDPWEMIARSCKEAGLSPALIQALQIAYLLRIDRLDLLKEFNPKNEEVAERLRSWGLLEELSKRLKG